MRRNFRYALDVKQISSKKRCLIYSQFNAGGNECGSGGKATPSPTEIVENQARKAIQNKKADMKGKVSDKKKKKTTRESQDTTHQEFCFTTNINSL